MLVIGCMGFGKLQFVIVLFVFCNFDEMLWVIIDYKGEDLIDDIWMVMGGKKWGLIKNLVVDDELFVELGLYYMNLCLLIDDVVVEVFLWKVYGKLWGKFGEKKYCGYCGLFIDEGYCLLQKGVFDVIFI